MTPEQTAWLAGILDGEGSFTMVKRPHPYPAVSLEMTDEDVVQRVAALVGHGNVRVKERPPWKTIYTWRVSGTESLRLMGAVLPWMSLRRTERICQITGDYHESRMRVCLECDTEFYDRPRAGPRAKCCSPACQAARNARKTREWKAVHPPWRKAAA